MLLPIHKISIVFGTIGVTAGAVAAGIAAVETQAAYAAYTPQLSAVALGCGLVGAIAVAAATSLGVISPSATNPSAPELPAAPPEPVVVVTEATPPEPPKV